jgi:hypothetical protein
LIDKEVRLKFSPFSECRCISFLEYWFESGYYTGLLQNQTTQFTQRGVNVGIDIYKGLQNQNTLRRANLSIVAAKYQLLKADDSAFLASMLLLLTRKSKKLHWNNLELTKNN